MRVLKFAIAVAVALFLIVRPVFAGEPGRSHAPLGSAQASHGSQPKAHPEGPKGERAPKPGDPKSGAAPNHSIATRIESHPQLASRLQALLPPGMTMETAAAGFKKDGQFIAALHVPRNLGIQFDQLKTQMVTDHRSLGQSIRMLKPSADASHEAERGESEAREDLAKKN